jgi:hypothetical protein
MDETMSHAEMTSPRDLRPAPVVPDVSLEKLARR